MPFINAFAFLVALLFGFSWGIFCFALIGPFIGAMAFQVFRSNEYVFYNNLGITKWKLLGAIYLMNLPMTIPVGIILYFLAASGIGFSGS